MKKNKEEKIVKYLRSLIFRCLTVIIIFLCLAILTKTKYKDLIVKKLYQEDISFIKIKNLYNKYLGGIVPLDKLTPTVTPVFNEQLEYISETEYYDGVKLEVNNKYLVPTQEEGMVVYIGEKENYGNVVIIEGIDGIDIWYGFMESTTVKLYDYIDKNTYLGQTKDNYLFLAYSKEGNFLEYKDYLK